MKSGHPDLCLAGGQVGVLGGVDGGEGEAPQLELLPGQILVSNLNLNWRHLTSPLESGQKESTKQTNDLMLRAFLMGLPGL